MKRAEAFKKCAELNPPLFPAKPMPHAVAKMGAEYVVIYLPTKKVVAK